MAKAAMLSPLAMLGKTGITGAAQALTKLGGGGLTSLSPLASLLKAPAAGGSALSAAGGAASGLAKAAIPTPQFKPTSLGGMPAPKDVAKIDIKPTMDAGMQGLMDKMKPSWLERNKGNMRDMGLSLMQAGMQQQSGQGSPMQLAPFQPTVGGGGQGGMQQGALMQLLQQYGMNKIQ